MIIVQLQSCCIPGWDADPNSSTSFSPHYCAISVTTKAAVDTCVPLRCTNRSQELRRGKVSSKSHFA